MSLVGRLMATLGLDSRGFNKGLKESESRVRRFGRSVVRIGASIAAGLAGVGAAVGRSADWLVDLDNQARLAGENAEEFRVLSIAAREYGIEQEKLADILKDVNDKFGDFAQTGQGPLADFFENIAPKVGVTIKSFEDLSSSDALQLYISSLEEAGVSQQELTFYMEALASDATALLPVFRDHGAALKSVQERAEELGLTLNSETIEAARTAKREFEVVSEVLRTRFHVALARIIPVLVAIANTLVPVLAAISAAFTKIVAITSVVAVAFGTRLAVAVGVRYVGAALAATRQAIALELALGAKSRAAALASISIKGLSRALVTLRTAMIRTGIGALVVGAGLLLEYFARLTISAGGVGNALKLLWAVALEAFGRIGPAAKGAAKRVHAALLSIEAAAVRVWAGVIGGATSAAEAIVDAGVGAAEAFKVAFRSIPGALGDFMFQAANSVIDGVEGMINAVVGRINKFIISINDALAMLPEWAGGGDLSIGTLDDVNLGNVGNPFAGQAGAAGQSAQDAYAAAQGRSDFSGRTAELEAIAAALDESAAAAQTASDEFLAVGTAPLSSVQALRSELGDTEETVDDTSDAVKRLKDELEKLEGGGGGDQTGLKKRIDQFKDGVRSVSNALAGAIVQGKSLGDAMRGVFQRMAQDLIASGIQKMIMGLFGFGGGGGSGTFGSLLGSLFGVPSYAQGTRNHPGGVAQVFEEGGELIDLPSGARVIPHDLSRVMMNAAGKSLGASASPAVSGAASRQEVVVSLSQTSLSLSDDGKIVAEIGIETDQKISDASQRAERELPQRVQKINSSPRDRHS